MPSARDSIKHDLRAVTARLPELFAAGTRLVVGFSGGQDSTCLLHALATSRLQLRIVAAHVDHGLRPDSAADAQRVAALAASVGVEAEIVRVDVGAYRKMLPGWSVQQVARSARHQVLASVARAHGAAAVLIAHTADDQAETLLINLLRGAGLAGLAAMRFDETLYPSRFGPSPPDIGPLPERVRVVRPLLRVSRATTLQYCTELGLGVVEDPSNQSRAYTRNRVRLDLLPSLEHFNPAIRTVLARTADLVGEDVAALDDVVAELHTRLAHSPAPAVFEYDRRLWSGQPHALQRRLLRHAIECLLGGLVDVRAAPVDDALDLLRSGSPRQAYHLPHGIELCIGRSSFLLRLHGGARSGDAAKTHGVQKSRAYNAYTREAPTTHGHQVAQE